MLKMWNNRMVEISIKQFNENILLSYLYILLNADGFCF